MVNVYLHGKLGEELGEKWALQVNTVSDALAAIDANTDRLFSFIQEHLQKFENYQILVDEEEICEDELGVKKAKKEIHVHPILAGSKKVGLMIAAAVLMIALPGIAPGLVGAEAGGLAAYGTMNFVGNMIVSMGIGLLIQGITSAMTKTPTIEESKQSQSYLFQGNVNNQTQGQAVPIGYGRLRVGSQVIGLAQRNRLLGENSYEEYEKKKIAAARTQLEAWLDDSASRYEQNTNAASNLTQFRVSDNKEYAEVFKYHVGSRGLGHGRYEKIYDYQFDRFENLTLSTIPEGLKVDI